MAELLNISSYRMQKLALIVFVGCVMVLFLTGFDAIKAKVRDVKRRADMRILIKALDLYHDKYGQYPASIDDWRGWDLSMSYNGSESDFLNKLTAEKFTDREVKDPVNNASYHYRYQKFQSGDYGCNRSFYVLQAVNFELSTDDNGQGRCPDFNWLESAPNGWTAQGFD